jgi:hypothetical protein
MILNLNLVYKLCASKKKNIITNNFLGEGAGCWVVIIAVAVVAAADVSSSSKVSAVVASVSVVLNVVVLDVAISFDSCLVSFIMRVEI